MHFFKVRLLFVILIISSNLTLQAQKVALVMSGGGAKGIAHAGVLKVLEENNIPIDYIVGTSMGSVVGGFYSAGYTPDQIKALAFSQDLQDWVDGIIDEKYKSSFNKSLPDPSWLSLKLDFDSAFATSIDPSLDKDYVLNINLAERLQHASFVCGGNFDSLFVPFRAIASNIFMEKEVVLGNGVLFESIRSSMAIPLLYRPVRVNGELLFDGGVYDNFPIQPAIEEFDPDIIIGVNVGSKVLKEYPTANDEKLIAESLLFFMLNKGDPSHLNNSDIFIDVPLDDYSTLDFEKAKEIYELGYNEASKQIDEIKRKIDRRSDPIEISERRKAFLSKPMNHYFDTVIVDGFNEKKTSYIASIFEKNKSFEFEQAKDAYFRLIDNDYFLNVFPSYAREKNHYSFRLSGNPNPRLRAKIGGSLTSRNISYMYLGIDFKRLSKVLMEYEGKLFAGPFYESFVLKNRVTLPGKKPFSFGPTITFNHRDYLNLSDYLLGKPDLTILDRVDRKMGIYFGFPLNRKFGLSSEGSYILNNDKYSNLLQINTNESFDEIELNGFRLETRLYHNSLNYPQFASSGSKIELSLNRFLIKSTYTPGSTSLLVNRLENEKKYWNSIYLNAEKYFELGDHFSLGAQFTGSYSNQPVFGTTKGTLINSPGFYPLQDSPTLFLEDYRARKYMSMGIKNVWLPTKYIQVRLEGYMYNKLESIIGDPGDVPSFEKSNFNPSYAATSGIVYHTIVGPIGLNVNYYSEGANNWGALLQIGYLLFNDHALE